METEHQEKVGDWQAGTEKEKELQGPEEGLTG